MCGTPEASSFSLWRLICGVELARANVLSADTGGSCHLHVMIWTFWDFQSPHANPSPTCRVRQCHLPIVNWWFSIGDFNEKAGRTSSAKHQAHMLRQIDLIVVEPSTGHGHA
jgi:hypothetical protein